MPILTTEKVNKRPPPPNPLPPPTPQKMNKRLSQRCSFLQSILQNLALSHLHLLLLLFFVLLQNKHTELAENGENLISAHPRISAHSQDPKI